MSRFGDQESLVTKNNLDERVRQLEELVFSMDRNFFNGFVKGRLRTDRIAPPSSSTDINDTDRLYDIIQIYPYQYILIDNGGNYNWVRFSLTTF